MKVLVFPASDFDLKDLEQMSDSQLYHLCESHRWGCESYCNEKEFQDAFNNGYVSDESFIFFID